MDKKEVLKEKAEKLAEGLRKFGWTASVREFYYFGDLGLKVEENPKLRSPDYRFANPEEVGNIEGRYIWDGYTAKNPDTIAKRLDSFLRSVGFSPLGIKSKDVKEKEYFDDNPYRGKVY